MTEKEKELIRRTAVEAWGIDSQALKCCEEMGELIKAICKRYFFGKSEKADKHEANFIEELADVQVMIDQLLLDVDKSKFYGQIDRKLKRIKNKLINQGYWEQEYDPELDREVL